MMTKTAEIIMQHIGDGQGGAEVGRAKGLRDGKEAIELLGTELPMNETFQAWVLAGFRVALNDGSEIAQVAVACNFIRLGYKVAMEELSGKVAHE